MKTLARFTLLLPGLFALCDTARADDTALVLDPSVVTGSRSASPTFDLPYSVDGISREQISDGQLGINASEALSRVPGLVVQNRQNYAQDLQISSRGFGARSAFGVRGIKLIADGIPASTPDGQGQAATFNLDTAERIEVLRGPAATLYGSNAGGVIQMFSRDGEGPPRIGAETLVGSDGLNKNHLSAEGAANGAGFVLDASRMDTNGYRDHSSARRDQTFAKLNVQPDDDSKLALIYSSLEQNGTQDPLGQTWAAYKADPRSVSSNALTYNTRKSIDHQQLGMNYERYFGDATLQVTGYTGRRSVIQYLSIPGTIPAGKRGGVVAFDRKFYGGSAHWLQPIASAPGDLTLIAGLDYDRSQDDRQGYSNTVNGVQGVKGALGRDETDTATSLDPFVQANWLLGDWTLQAGLRHNTMKMEVDDRFISGTDGDDSGSKTYQKNTPSVSVMYAFTPDLHGYVSAGKGFETPTQAESAYSSSSNGFNFALKPSVSTQYEIGLKARLGQDTRINAAVFQITTEDELVIQQSVGGRSTYQNAGRTLRRGLELGIESQLAEHWSTSLAYTRLQATYDSDFVSGTSTVVDKGNYLPGVPQTTLFAELNWKPRDWLSTAVEGMYRSKVYVEDTNSQHAAPGYSVFNWRARFEQKVEHWTFHQTLRLDNLLDRQYVGSVIVGDGNGRYYEAAPGRSWYAGAGAEYQF
ncbi:TonB-dependent siderophore receptor [Pseudomonas sp. S35]|uniref:TonB-dependent receptor family protein n=1 Tax=Pseudomonas sp. S35 TaxID=1573719 RepID=UPI00132EA21C|nr:TonB-dependent receptor [Pseudomonas sp. S35]QHF42692.1 TonB-dependent siderophore receptor [Pseudomonas sp. S35]